MVNVATMYRETYQSERGLEEAVIDLVRVGSTGLAAGVRQLAVRLARTVPDGVEDPVAFKAAMYEAIAQRATAPALRMAPGELPQDHGAGAALVRVEPFPDVHGLELNPTTSRLLNDLARERGKALELQIAGISMTRTVLLSGPPGVGKTLAARWIASVMGVPLVSLDLATVVSSMLGSSGRNIRSAFDYAQSGPCIFFLDEFDALAKRRDDDADIGELKRVVNVVLLELDRWSAPSLLIAATNHAHLLDPAVYRRFDRHIIVPLPTTRERRAILFNHGMEHSLNDDRVKQFLIDVTEGCSGSDLVRIWTSARRRMILDDVSAEAATLEEIAINVPELGTRDRDRLWLMLADHLGLSARQIAVRAGVSHPTVSAGIRRARAAA